MAYIDIFNTELNEITELIKANKIKGENEALQRFTAYLDTIQTIGQFDIINWQLKWRKNVWSFGQEFQKLNPQHFLKLIDDKLKQEETLNKEVLEFIRSEIVVNFLPDNECKKQLEALIEEYPLNSEFRHTLGQYYSKENKLLLAISEYKLALKIEPRNDVYLKQRFRAEYEYLTQLIADSEYQTGKKYLNQLLTERPYDRDPNFHNSLVDFNARLDDHISFQSKLKTMESEFRERMHSELESERKRIIEVLGFFSAIVAFILSTVSIGKNFSFIEAMYFIVALGIILILFAVSLSTLFTTPKIETYKDRNFWILIVGLFLLFLFIIMTNSITTLLQRLTS